MPQIEESVQQRTMEQIVDILVSQSPDEVVGVIMLTPQARTSRARPIRSRTYTLHKSLRKSLAQPAGKVYGSRQSETAHEAKMCLFYLTFLCSPKVAMTVQLEFGLYVAVSVVDPSGQSRENSTVPNVPWRIT